MFSMTNDGEAFKAGVYHLVRRVPRRARAAELDDPAHHRLRRGRRIPPPDTATRVITHRLTQGQPNANNFATDGRGTLIFTGGTGLFKGAKGKATFTAVFGQGIGFYIVDGKVSAGGGD